MRTAHSLPLVLLAACVSPVHESEVAELDQAIVGGTQTSTTTFPTVVGLQQGNGNWFCTGVLVHKDWVMTTASCFDNNNTTQVRLDDNNLNDGGGRNITVAEIRKHPQFSLTSSTWNHDIAMLRLAESVTDRPPSAIRRDAATVGTSVTQVGYGYNNNNGGGGGVLRSLTTSSTDCANANDSGITNANLMCFNAGDGTGSCYGDGGAPAFVGTTKAIAGVASGGTGSSCTSGLDIYTAISAELEFIDSVLPAATPPPVDPTDPTPPVGTDPTNPDSPGDDPVDPPDDDDGRPPVARGCSTGAGAAGGWIALLGIALALQRASRRHRRVRDQ